MHIAYNTLLHHRDTDGRFWTVLAVVGDQVDREPQVRLSVNWLTEIGVSITCSDETPVDQMTEEFPTGTNVA